MRRDNRACVLVTDRARERGRDPMPGGAGSGLDQGWGGIVSPSGGLRILRRAKTLFLGLGQELGRVTAPNWVPASCPRTAHLPILRVLLTVLLCSQ